MTVVVFDLDGTLTDTEEIWDVVRREMAAQDQISWPESATTAMMGMATQEWSAYLSDVVGLAGSAADSERRTLDGMLAAYRVGIPVLPDAVAAVQRIARRWPVGVASSSPRMLIDAAIGQLGLEGVFGATASTEELGGAGKPAPDVYLEVCRRLQGDPTRSVAVEDSHNGILSAHAAGMVVVAVPPHFHPPAADTLALCDVVLDSLTGLTPDLVTGLLAARDSHR